MVMLKRFFLILALLVNTTFAFDFYGMGATNYDFIASLSESYDESLGVKYHMQVDKFNKKNNKILHNDDKKYKKLDIDLILQPVFFELGDDNLGASFGYMLGFGYSKFDIPQGLHDEGVKYNAGLGLDVSVYHLTTTIKSIVSASSTFDLDNKNRVLFTLGPKYWPMITFGYEYRIFKVKDFKSNNHSLMLGLAFVID